MLKSKSILSFLNAFCRITILFIVFQALIISCSLINKTGENTGKHPYEIQYIDERQNEFEGNLVVRSKHKDVAIDVLILSLENKTISSMQIKGVGVFHVEQPKVKVLIKNH